MKLEYPLNDALPNIEHTRDRLLARIFDFRKNGDKNDIATDEDYELLYAYGESKASNAASDTLLIVSRSFGDWPDRAGYCIFGTGHRETLRRAQRGQPEASVNESGAWWE